MLRTGNSDDLRWCLDSGWKLVPVSNVYEELSGLILALGAENGESFGGCVQRRKPPTCAQELALMARFNARDAYERYELLCPACFAVLNAAQKAQCFLAEQDGQFKDA